MTRLRLQLGSTDALLLAMTGIWGANYSVVKLALGEIPPPAFNSLRLGLASVLFLATIAARRGAPLRLPANDVAGTRVNPIARPRIPPADWLALAALGIVGHFVYQLCFIGGIARTTASNTSLIFGASPVVVALLSAAVGHERVRPQHWVGAVLSALGVYLLVGLGASLVHATFIGDLLLLSGVGCWAVYTVGSRPLLARHSPLVVTGYSMAIGTACYLVSALPALAALDWSRVSATAWLALAGSATFALFVAYLIWYTAVQRIGNVRTSMYSNLTPLIAVLVAAIWLDERLTPVRIAGGCAIVLGAALTRLVVAATPVEE